MKISARNLIKGIIKSITPDALNAEVLLDIGGGREIVARITLGSVKRLGLRKGAIAYAVIKADSVMIGVDD